MLEKLKILLGIEDNSKDYVLQLTIDIVTDMVLNYCHIKEIPSGLENVVVSMCIDKYRAENYGQENSEGKVKSISEGDVSVSFGSAFSISENPSMEFLKNYKSQLNIYRKVVW
ncbi:hypothetical protein B5E58_10840 [Tyzzerella sp. An114]|uniref:phage head-tail connector protein n=1 Tax=Tyzzerella sp. An114 TaxID=1965545 RepID=UPI000B43CE95|nr:phage head-tail connector protein [Tyzzerella sp. An114]OUQ56336.1 hypothetical protein B5E58_10840 [Tyzzerella sp. An114]